MVSKETFAKAADIIKERGWYQGWFYGEDRENGPVCLVGAINLACGRDPDSCSSDDAEAVDKALRRKLKKRVFAANWNDKPSRTKEQVLSFLRSAAK